MVKGTANLTGLSEFICNAGLSVDQVKTKIGLPASYPHRDLPLEEMDTFYTYHKTPNGWGDWVERQIDRREPKAIFVEGWNWGDWDAEGRETTATLAECFIKTWDKLEGYEDSVLREFAEEISKNLVDRISGYSGDGLRILHNNRDYNMKLVVFDDPMLECLEKSNAELIAGLKKNSDDKIVKYSNDLNSLENSLESKLESGVGKISELRRFSDSANRKTLELQNAMINDVRGFLKTSEKWMKVFVHHSDGRVGFSPDPPQSHDIGRAIVTPLGFWISSFSFEERLDRLPEKVKKVDEYLDRSEQRSMNKTMYRLQIIMTCGVFLQVAALFQIRRVDLVENWDVVGASLLASIFLTGLLLGALSWKRP